MTKKKTHGGARRGSGRSTFFAGKKSQAQFSVTFTDIGNATLEHNRARLRMSRSDFLQALVLLHPTFKRCKEYSNRVPPPRTLLFTQQGRKTLDAIVARTGCAQSNVLESLLMTYADTLTLDDVSKVQ